MNKEKRKQVSVYLKAGERAATSYYRFYQYFKNLDADVKYNLMIPDNRWNDFFPIARQPKWKQVYIFFYIYLRVLGNLLSDAIKKTDCLIISRCIINKIVPLSFKIILKIIKRNGCKIIWDIDDNIIGTEMTRANFDWFSDFVDIIIVGSPILKELVCEQNRNKVLVLPTTDGDMHYLISDEIKNERLKTFEKIVKFIWVGTFSSLPYVERITEAFEEASLTFKKQGKELQLIVVCDKKLRYIPKNFSLFNLKWEKHVSIEQMLHAHVGIMPLENNENNRGKCGFKLIQYLSAGLPIIGSTVGINQMIIKEGCGIGVEELNITKWTNAIKEIAIDAESWKQLSLNAYKDWENHYNHNAILSEWKDLILTIAS